MSNTELAREIEQLFQWLTTAQREESLARERWAAGEIGPDVMKVYQARAEEMQTDLAHVALAHIPQIVTALNTTKRPEGQRK